jgi:lipopolysaccharide transport system ATP-binding protein
MPLRTSDTMKDIAIRVQNLSKCYHVYEKPRDRLKQFVLPHLRRMIWQTPRHYFREFWALNDVSFTVNKGETVGIIGRNGSGKSTLLQMICGTLNPTSGNVQINGRVAALLELGSGFNPEFTGRENVYVSAALLGYSEKEIDARFDDIAAFADIGNFIEQPVKTYSSGMFVRLAFAVNIVSEPDIMIVDEALAVGDMNFQAKCMTALTRIQENGATVLFVSHDVGAVKSLCSRGVYLENGAVKAIGKASDVAELYIRTMREEMNAEQRKFTPKSKSPILGESAMENRQSVKTVDAVFKRSEEFDRRVASFRYGSGGAKITYAELLDEHDDPVISVEFDQEVSIAIHFETDIEDEISCNYYVADEKRNLVIGSGMRQAGENS